MSLIELLSWLEHTPVALAISKSNHLVGAALQVVHILGFVLLLAAVVFIDLRLLGLAFRNHGVPQITRGALRLVRWGLVLAVVSGALMFAASPALYAYKPVFQAKMALFLLAVLLHGAWFRHVASQAAPSRPRVLAGVLLSLLGWFGIGLAGRMIGFA